MTPSVAAGRPPETPPYFIDPVTYAVMADPVMCNDGRTYDRSTAERLSLSPFTRAPLEVLVDNVGVRGDIFEAHPELARLYHAARAVPRAAAMPPSPGGPR
ncbi:MAG TPA: U-box domain-containing protein, partial [Myxococcota bacterium]|nr:U-box domain-containing protein [Myxococcota bacterium]